MFEAQLLNNNSAVYSPWMSRGGDNLTFTLEVIDKNLSEDFIVTLYQKNSEDPGPGTPFTVSSSPLTIATASIGIEAAEANGVEELVRYKFSFDNEAPGDWVLFRMLAPVWFDDVKA